MISKKLLSEVFGREIRSSILIEHEYTHNNNKLLFQFSDIHYGGISGIEDEEINIHELANMCKEWALKQKYRILTEPYNDYGHTDWMVEAQKYEKSNPQRFELYSTEPEAVFKACEWILINKKKIINEK